MNQLPPSPIELNQTEDEEIRLSIEEPSRRGGQSIFERLVSHLPLPKNKWDYTPLFKQQQTIRPIVSSWKRIVFVSLPLFVLIFLYVYLEPFAGS